MTAKTGSQTVLESYHCTYEPLFGLDVEDMQGVNAVLERVIQQAAESRGAD